MARKISTPASSKRIAPGFDWQDYDPGNFYDEVISSPGNPRAASRGLAAHIRKMSIKGLLSRQQAADLAIQEMGISFTVYDDGQNIDRSWPMDILPRIIPLREWQGLEAGLIQRLTALNMFINDIYHKQQILKDGVVPREIIASSPDFLKQCIGAKPRHDVWAHVCGSDLVRDGDGTMYVLEDNLRVPSGVSYMLENRAVSKRVLPQHKTRVFHYRAWLRNQYLRRGAHMKLSHWCHQTLAKITKTVSVFDHSYRGRQMIFFAGHPLSRCAPRPQHKYHRRWHDHIKRQVTACPQPNIIH
jgi:uncharacterized circularly permuted ATP-grasp superfamily protein